MVRAPQGLFKLANTLHALGHMAGTGEISQSASKNQIVKDAPFMSLCTTGGERLCKVLIASATCLQSTKKKAPPSGTSLRPNGQSTASFPKERNFNNSMQKSLKTWSNKETVTTAQGRLGNHLDCITILTVKPQKSDPPGGSRGGIAGVFQASKPWLRYEGHGKVH